MIDKEELPTTKNDLAVEDCISRAEVLKLMQDNWHTHNGDWAMQESMDDIRALPSVTPQEPMVIPIAEVKFDEDKLKELVDKAVFTVTPNIEPFINKPCVSEKVCEHDKQMILDKIRAEIKAMFPPSGAWMYEEGHEVEHTVCEVLSDVLKIIDKYKAESEPQESEDKT